MLDVGGGGGFYAKAFEDLGYGLSTYIDLDFQSCRFANELGLKNVIHGNAVLADYGDKKFDLIMCRHLIEHLKDPVTFVFDILKLSGKSIKRGSGDHQSIGSPSLYQGKMPEAYAESKRFSVKSPPIANKPSGSASSISPDPPDFPVLILSSFRTESLSNLLTRRARSAV